MTAATPPESVPPLTSMPPTAAESAATPAQPPAFVDVRCGDSECHAKGAYRMIGYCLNCGLDPVLGLFTVGHERRNGILGAACPVCETWNLRWKRLATPDEIPAGFEADQ